MPSGFLVNTSPGMHCEAYRGLIRGHSEEIEAAWRFARAIEGQGLVALRLEDPLRFALAFLHILDCGGCPLLQPCDDEIHRIKPDLIVDDQGVTRLPGGGKAQAGCYYAFSSGSTGRRRLLRFDSQRALANARAHARSLHLTDRHILAQTLRLHHPFGVVAYLFTPLVCGAQIELGVFFDSLLSLGGDLSRHVLHLTPYHLRPLMRRAATPDSRLGKLTLGAGPVQAAEARFALELCSELYTTYGLSEAGPRVTTGRVQADRFVDGWIGHLLEGVEARIDEEGCLWLRSAYYAETSDFFSTGDRVERLSDGSLVFVNRLHDVLRIRGRTYPRPAYNHKLESLSGVASEVCQLPHSDALVVFLEGEPQPGLEAEIFRHLPELRGARVNWIPVFERTALGKTDLRRMLQQL